MDGETLLLTLIEIREQAQSEEEYDAAVAALLGEKKDAKFSLPAPRSRTSPVRVRPGGYRRTRLQGKSILLSVEEHYGSEAPGPGWTSDGEGRWVKTEEPAPPKGKRESIRIAVVGGGPSGLFTTYLLNQKIPQAAVTIYEASDRLGGKVLTAEFSDGSPYEAGVAELYEYLGPGGKDPLRLLIEKELNLPTKDMIGGAVILSGEVLHDLNAVEEFHSKPTRKVVENFHKKMVELMPLERYANRWQPDPSHPWANVTFLECVLDECKGDQTATDYILAAVHSDLATSPHVCNGLNGIKNVLMDNPEYMKLYHIEGGIGKLAEALEEAVDADVHLGAPVLSVEKRREKYRVRYGPHDAHDDFDAVVLAMPNHWLAQFRWSHPEMRAAMQRLLAHYDMPAHYLRVSLLFNTKWWSRLKIEGDYWMIDVFGGCCCYDESTRWGAEAGEGHVLSFLIAGTEALNLCSNDQTDEQIAHHLLRELPPCMAEAADHLIEYAVNRWVGALNAMPGGWPSKELIGQHTPEPKEYPGIKIVGDFLFDSTLNAALISASTTVDLLIEHLGVTAEKGGVAAAQLEPIGSTL